jgi:putative sigma-54 modulation protein
MKVTYKGLPHALPPKIQQKLDGKFAKIAKLLDGQGGEREARVIVVQERHLCRAEVTVQFYDNKLVGIGSDSDLFTALSAALEKLDGQAVKQRAKQHGKNRRKDAAVVRKQARSAAPAEAAGSTRSEAAGKRVFRMNGLGRRKPMTLDEAVLEMDTNRDYLVYRDADRDTERQGLSVLVRRRDGHFDLIES